MIDFWPSGDWQDLQWDMFQGKLAPLESDANTADGRFDLLKSNGIALPNADIA
ncbi:hypothetical protein [Paraburkholderia sp. JPY419]|uniref:hypothetical protein n=1 Tax=Paraburkholderia sp. JPY419 TaxID=667660 RepID=UPI003D20DC13